MNEQMLNLHSPVGSWNGRDKENFSGIIIIFLNLYQILVAYEQK